MSDTDLTQATDTINNARTGALQEHQVLTINDQILEHEMAIALNETSVDAMQDQIKKLRRDIKRREKEQARLRLQREIFARAAFELKQAGMP